ncbi:MAG: beta-ketoacyl-[acyl-carrier-protein] synthase family protein [Solirubrobacteraceae bacterium]
MSASSVVVTGIGAVTPLGVGARTLHERWLAGRSGIEDGEGAARGFQPGEHLSLKEIRRADRFTQLALVAGDEALAEAGWSRGDLPYDADRIGVVVGTGIGGIGTLEHGKEAFTEHGPRMVPPLSVPLMMSNAAPAALSMRYGIRGNSYATLSACAAGAHAIGQSMRMIQAGDADAVVTGGSEAALTPLVRAMFSALDALSPTGVSRPFDARRDGFVMGEGAGILVLEDEEKAAARGATVLAYVRGYGACSDAHHLTAPDAQGTGGALAITRALQDAGATPADVIYVNAHGTSTPLNDRAETKAIKAALGDRAQAIPVSSTKSAIGHLLGAAGAVEAVATILALRDAMAPPTLGHEHPEEDLDLDYVAGEAKRLQLPDTGRPLALSNSFGFGGHNVVLALEAGPHRYQARSEAPLLI